MNSDAIPVFNSQDIISADRNTLPPFRIILEQYGKHREFTCNGIFRFLPGKRLVLSGLLGDVPAIAKCFLSFSKGKRHVEREIRGVDALCQAGIDTPEVLLKSRIDPLGIPVVCFERIFTEFDYERLLNEPAQREDLGDHILHLVSIIAKSHNSGIKQDDVHLGNFLLQGETVHIIDGANIDTRGLGNPLPMAESLDNLGLFFAQILPCFDEYIIPAFIEYLKLRNWKPEDHLNKQLKERIRRHRSIRKNKYLKKIYRDCSEFICRKSWRRFQMLTRSRFSKEMEQLVANPDTAMAGGRMLKDGGASTVALVEVNHKPLVVKRYNRKSLKHFLRRCLRNSRAHVSWRNAHLLTMLGISTGTPVAMLENRWGPFCLKAYFISEYIEGPNSYDLLHSGMPADHEMENLLNRFTKLIKTLARFSISHGDFKGTNFIVSDKALNLIDLDAMQEHSWKWRFERAHAKDLKRFMKNWDDLPGIRTLFSEKFKQTGLYR